MLDKDKVNSFWNRRAEVNDPVVATHLKHDDAVEYDENLVRKYIKSNNVKVLDLGCGTGRTTNRIEKYVGSIRAVDKQQKFLDHCIKSKKVELVCADVETYLDETKYDIILLFGVMNYLSLEEANNVYKNCKKMLGDGGVLLVKHACGVKENVYVDHYSEAIADNYCAEYRYVELEKNLLENEGFNVEILDIYPDHLNPWSNTHFYAFICTSK
ncbi:class I SAM-dependent methyltransferase [Paenibacillus provencensis]|uniref:Class I SAM-dependent methyltransferase n=1 Tax=Paenibacillus provencensis TaxID=441151 RepID=A0ABW3PZJ7_9BACL|nr:class I SAM-dependent methyltransferase [Paenibacillus sp. MER 78]MCM3128277.1 class I SAM-dependent methyltransferase [Paenibacillus sp. MER 78]